MQMRVSYVRSFVQVVTMSRSWSSRVHAVLRLFVRGAF